MVEEANELMKKKWNNAQNELTLPGCKAEKEWDWEWLYSRLSFVEHRLATLRLRLLHFLQGVWLDRNALRLTVTESKFQNYFIALYVINVGKPDLMVLAGKKLCSSLCRQDCSQTIAWNVSSILTIAIFP
jgi:hypothetical protein